LNTPTPFKPRVSWAALWPGLAIAVALLGFASLAQEAREGGINAMDRLTLSVLRAPGSFATAPPWVQELTRDITALGGFTVLSLLTTFAAAMMLQYRQHRQATVFALTVILSQALTEGLKAIIARPRPTLVSQHDIVYSLSFPSGHTTMSTVVYLTLAAIVCRAMQRSGARALTLGAAISLVFAIGITRIELGVHWPSDVLAGWLLGTAITMIAIRTLNLRNSHAARAN
jgi:undecaprenyl-diphosphatase